MPREFPTTPERSALQEARRAQERRLYLAAYGGLAGSLAATAFAALTGSVGLLVISILLTGFSSMVPEMIALRRTRRRCDAREDRRAPLVIGPETWQRLAIHHESAANPPPEWRRNPIDYSEHTIH